MTSAFVLSLISGPQLIPVIPATSAGVMAEWRVAGVNAPENPFDPRQASLVASVTTPGDSPKAVHAFWQVPTKMIRKTDGGWTFQEQGPGYWCLRFTPTSGGRHRISIGIFEGGRKTGRASSEFQARPAPVKGFIRPSKVNPHYLSHFDGSSYIPLGWNVCWYGAGGLADYEMWAEGMAKGKMNFVRLWMSPWCFGIETSPTSLGRYEMGPAEALDKTIEIFRKRGIHVMLCFDYHGMLNEVKDFWGSNDNWKNNPYNAANGGPARNQNEFFTLPRARSLYKQRLRYLVARYGAHPNVGFWEFWNEIDNVRSTYKEADMIAWHKEMAEEVRRLDPYGRIVTSSLTSDIFPSLWTEANLDLTQSHSYNQSGPGVNFARRAERFRTRFDRPWLMGEYGVDYRAPNLEADPKHRGLKQAIWGSLIGGGAGSAMSWWWETLHPLGVYPYYRALNDFTIASGIGSRGWKPLEVTSAEEEAVLPPLASGGMPFDVRLALVQEWAGQNRGFVILTDRKEAGAQTAHVNGFLHGTSKPELKRPFRFVGHFAEGARIGLMVNSVSHQATLEFWISGRKASVFDFPDKDGKTDVNGEYMKEVWVDIPPGQQEIEVKNTGPDWAALDWVEIQKALPAVRAPEEAIPLGGAASGSQDGFAAWILDRAYSYPANAKEREARLVTGGWLAVKGVRDGRYEVRWFDTAKGTWLKTETVAAAGGRIRLTPPPFQEDIAAIGRRL